MTEANKISAEIPDWSREEKSFFAWNPSRSLLASIRSYQKMKNSHHIFAYCLSMFAILKHRFWSVVAGAEIPINTQIGGGLLIPHPNGSVIHSDVKIGPNCLIFQQVTIGSTAHSTVPMIGGHVDIGAGAKLLGSIKVSNHAKIGANAVVLIDVPEGKSAVGIPAKII